MTTSQQPGNRRTQPPSRPLAQSGQIPPQWRPPQRNWTPQPPDPARWDGRAPRNGLGTAALVLGILGVLFSFIPFIGVIAWPLTILGLIFGSIGFVWARAGMATNGGVAIAGAVLSLIGLIICVAYLIFSVAVVASLPATPAPTTSVPTASAPTVSTPTMSIPTVSAPRAGQGGAATTGKPGDTLTAGDMQVIATALRSQSEPIVGPMKCANVTYRNTGSVQESFGMFDWTLQDPAGAITGPTIFGDDLLSTGELAPGGTTSGQVCFDVKNSQAGAYTLMYSGGLFRSDKVSWTN